MHKGKQWFNFQASKQYPTQSIRINIQNTEDGAAFEHDQENKHNVSVLA